MFELWAYSLFLFGVAFVSYIIIRVAKKTGKVFVDLIYPPFDKEKMPEHYRIRIFILYSLIVFCVIFGTIFLLVDVPDTPESKPEFTSAEFEEMLIGNWIGTSMYFDEEIKLTIRFDYSCQATYNETIYNGHWQDDTNKYANKIKFTWDVGEELQVPSPFGDLLNEPLITLSGAQYNTGGILYTNPGVSFTKDN
jgi:hypothetical protein